MVPRTIYDSLRHGMLVLWPANTHMPDHRLHTALAALRMEVDAGRIALPEHLTVADE